MSVHLNLVFHDIVESESEINSRYTVSIGFYNKIKNEVLRLLHSEKSTFNRIRFYFDDNYASFYNLIFPTIGTEEIEYLIAVPTEFIGKNGHMTSSQLKELDKNNIKVSSHGISHAALCIYSGDKLLTTKSGGVYSNSSYGKKKSLTEEEVAYQLIESRKELNNIGIKKVDEFVLPYGLYNKQTLSINKSRVGYKYISTCNEYLDTSQSLRPRLLIVSDTTSAKTINKIKGLKSRNRV